MAAGAGAGAQLLSPASAQPPSLAALPSATQLEETASRPSGRQQGEAVPGATRLIDTPPERRFDSITQ